MEDIARRVLEMVGPGAEAEVFVGHTALALTRFANSFIHQNVADATTSVRLRLHEAGRTASGSTTVTTDEGLAGLVRRTREAARLVPPDLSWPGLAPPTPLGGEGNWDEATAHADPDARADRVRAFVDAAGGLETAGYCRTQYSTGAFANSAGQSASGRTAEVAMDAIARIDGADGLARLASGRLSEVDGAVLGARAAAKARASSDAVELPPGRYEVVLEAPAVADLLQNFALYGFNGKSYNERRSFAEPGAEQFDKAITLVDDTLGATGLGLPFDAEGTPKRRVSFVSSGVTEAVAHDRRTAAEGGAESTGHAIPGGGAFGAMPASMRLEPDKSAIGGSAVQRGAAVDPASAPLVATVERGLLVTDLWYTRVLDPKSLVVTGLTRNGVWLIENGEIIAPVRNFRFTQSYPQALGPGAVLGVGAEVTTMPDGWGTVWRTAPALRLASWNFTGGASG